MLLLSLLPLLSLFILILPVAEMQFHMPRIKRAEREKILSIWHACMYLK